MDKKNRMENGSNGVEAQKQKKIETVGSQEMTFLGPQAG